MTPQSTIAHYRVISKLGEGGMGAVYRATDTKLNRDVAIKVLPDAFAAEADRLARFTREAQVLASLNHPNIAAIYGVEERALVLELVEGPTLAERIDAGALPLDEVMLIARQIAEALEYAHEKGIVHRDLKPANIKITPHGVVKVLDFGLAKALAEDAAAMDPRSSPTITMGATMAGAIMGTAAYMSPEQAKGKPVDRRSDIWSFGVVLVEMLTGKPFYSGETVNETLAAVILKDPDWSGVPAETPKAIRRLIQRCLEKQPKRRLQAIGEARLMIEDANLAEEPAAAAVAPVSQSRLPAYALIGVVVVAIALGMGWWRASRPIERPLQRFSADLGPDAVAGTSITTVISPDGKRIVFPIRGDRGQQLATQLLSEAKSFALPATENGFGAFFSSDGEWIGFFADGKLKKISVYGGAAVTLCGASNGRGAAWSEDGNIVASMDGIDLWSVPAAGGTPRVLIKAADAGVRFLRYPQVLPGSQTVIATGGSQNGYDDGSIIAISAKTGQAKVVHKGGYFGRYVPSGHVIYVNQGVLFAVPFDISRLETRGSPVPVLDDVAGSPNQGGGNLDISATGTLVVLQGKRASLVRPTAWLDSTGKLDPVAAKGSNLCLSPDGKRLAMMTDADLVVYDFERSTSSRLTFKADQFPVWTPDGKHLIYVDTPSNSLMLIRGDGSGKPVEFERPGGVSLGLPTAAIPTSISPDGKHLLTHAGGTATNRDIYILPVNLTDPDHPKVGKPEPFAADPGADVEGVFSPDGKWVAYSNSGAGPYQVIVRAFPLAQGGKWQISSSPGRFPRWSRNGKELFYSAPDGHVMVASFTAVGRVFVPGVPRPWSPTLIQNSTSTFVNFDVHPDGKRLIVNTRSDSDPEKQPNVHATFMLNFFDELKRVAH